MRAFLAIATVVGCVAFLFYNDFVNRRDLDSVMNRSQVAADSHDMLEYLSIYKENMEKKGVTKGHGALFMKTMENDFAMHYKAVNRLIERLVEINKMEKNSVEYQTALADVRGVLNDIEFIGANVTWIKLHWLLWWTIVFLVVIWLSKFFAK